MDPMYQVTGKLTKESDVYTFGVLLLEVLCGVPELVDTDDYQERHVTELVPKRLEQQNMLRKIVHFDIRDEITSESLETYSKIASRCVLQDPDKRPTMAEVVIELEKALRFQGGELPQVHILGSSNGKGHLPEETVDTSDQEKSKQEESFPGRLLDSEESGIVTNVTGVEAAKKEIGESTDDADNTKEIPMDLKAAIEEYEISEVDKKSKIVKSTTYSNNGDNNDTLAMQEQSHVDEGVNVEKDNTEDANVTAMEITMAQEPSILDSDNVIVTTGKHTAILKGQKTPEFTVNNITRDVDVSEFATNDDDDDKLLSNQDFGSKTSNNDNSTCSESESNNGDEFTPSDYLIKSPANGNMKKTTTSYGSGNCCCCSWWCYLFDSVVFYGGQFWNEVVCCFNGISSSKRD
ncbi:uncharacterized protein [Rutidosis leptorrhynchoides]|uniref:uncharacterized protein isoform X2 n=1 Tax=Rutidosis leptorrhynchoides TaxID=125765 RepID=UPI003A99434A